MNKKHNPSQIKNAKSALIKLRETVKLEESGGVSMGEGHGITLIGILADSINYEKQLLRQRRYLLTQSAVVNLSRRSDSLSWENLCNESQKLQKDYLKQPEKSLVIATTISIRYFAELSSIKLDSGHITFSHQMPKRFNHSELASRFDAGFRYPNRYTAVRVRVNARDIGSALEIAENSLDIVRGIWNLYLQTGYRKYTSGDTPYSDIVPGQASTIHYPSGKAAEYQCWYVEQRPTINSPKDIKKRYPELKVFERKTRKIIKKEKIGSDIEQIILLYIRALDLVDRNSSYLGLWSVLEKLTCTFSNDEAIRRASFIFRDTTLARLQLGYIRSCRNNLVHDRSEHFAAESVLNELKIYVERLLLFLIEYASLFETIAEFGGFLSLPASKEHLIRKMKHIELANKLYA